MAIFNEEYLSEMVGWHGKSFVTNDEIKDPKFRKEQYEKVSKFIKDAMNSEIFAKEFSNSHPTFIEFDKDSDDDHAFEFGRWIGFKDRVIPLLNFTEDDDISSAEFFTKLFAKAKKEDSKLYGVLKISWDKYAHDRSLDYKL